jgi:hypothetical protein
VSADYDVIVIRAAVPLEVLRDTIRPFPTFSEIYGRVAPAQGLSKARDQLPQTAPLGSAGRPHGGSSRVGHGLDCSSGGSGIRTRKGANGPQRFPDLANHPENQPG